MSQVTDTYLYKATVGETISATDANNLFNSISTASTSINDTNTRTEAISRRHLKDLSQSPLGEHPTFPFILSATNAVASLAYTNVVFQDITHGGSATINLAAPVTLKAGECIRLQMSINMDECTKGISGGGTNALDADNYFFAFFVNINGVNTQVSPSYGYSLLCNSGSTISSYQNNNVSFSDKIQSQLIVNQREAFSYIYFNKTGIDQVITNVRVRFRCETPPAGSTVNTIKLGIFQFVAMGGR